MWLAIKNRFNHKKFPSKEYIRRYQQSVSMYFRIRFCRSSVFLMFYCSLLLCFCRIYLLSRLVFVQLNNYYWTALNYCCLYFMQYFLMFKIFTYNKKNKSSFEVLYLIRLNKLLLPLSNIFLCLRFLLTIKKKVIFQGSVLNTTNIWMNESIHGIK